MVTSLETRDPPGRGEAIALVDDGDLDPFVWAFADRAWVAAFQGDPEAAIGFIKARAARPTRCLRATGSAT